MVCMVLSPFTSMTVDRKATDPLAGSGTQTGEGSGVVIRSDGTILTNDHVINAAAGTAGQVDP